MAPNICCGDLAVEGTSSKSGKLCSKKFTQPGQQEVKIGNFTFLSPFRWLFKRPSNSVPSSIMVRSAAKSVSNTYLKPSWRSAAAIFPVTKVPGSSPNSSPKAARTEGAVCTTTVLVGSLNARSTWLVWSTSVKAPVGHTETHCPQ